MKVKRIRNGKTWTEATYWGRVRGALRKTFANWSPAKLAMIAARRPYNGPNKRQRFEVQCRHCNEWFKQADIRKDHVIPVGSLRCMEDLCGFLERLTPEAPEAFQMLCNPCHDALTKKENAERKIAKKKTPTSAASLLKSKFLSARLKSFYCLLISNLSTYSIAPSQHIYHAWWGVVGIGGDRGVSCGTVCDKSLVNGIRNRNECCRILDKGDKPK